MAKMKKKNDGLTVTNYDFYFIKEHPYTNLIISSSNTYHSHVFWEFAISLGGEYKNDIGNEHVILREGNIILLRPEDGHNCHCFKNGHTHRDIYVPVEKMRNVCNMYDPTLYDKLKSAPMQVNFYVGKAELENLKKDLDVLDMFQKSKSPHTETLFVVIVSHIIGMWLKNQISATNDMPSEIVNLVNKINSGFFFGNTVAEIAATTNYSHGYLCKLFKEKVGVSLVDYVRDFKLSYAFYLLPDKNLRIIDISNMIDYDVPSSFVNAFRKKYGTSPNAMRKKILQNKKN